VAGHARSAPNHAGAHFLRDRSVAAELVRRSGVRRGDLVLDLGAGSGAITAPLLAAGARVVAVERDAHLVTRLRRHFEGAAVTVVHGDLRRVPLPRRRYSVVASIPFATTASMLHRLLDDARGAPQRVELLIEWGMARRLTAARPRDLATAWWAARFDLRLRRRVPAACFQPPPRIDAAHLSVRPRPLPADPRGQGLLRSMLRTGFAHPAVPLLTIAAGTSAGAARSHRALRRALADAGLDPAATTASATAAQWHDLTLALLANPAGPSRGLTPAHAR
jgi:23S rRNA (adenine-N6)-dimethyltransferase